MSEEFNFEITDSPPAGKSRGRGPSPFVAPLRESYEKGFVDTGEWYEFYVAVEDVEKTVQRIRTAGQSAKVGTEVRQDEATGRITFRGVEYVPRPRAENGSGSAEASTEDSGDSADHAGDVPVNPAGEPFEWDDKE